MAYVQSNNFAIHTGGSISLAFPGNVTLNDLIFVGAGFWQAFSPPSGTPIVSDSQGNVYHLLATKVGGQSITWTWWTKATATGPCTVTVTNIGTDQDMIIAEYSGLTAPNPLDTVVTAGNPHTPFNTGDLNTSFPVETLILWAYDQTNANDAWTLTPSAGWTHREQTVGPDGTNAVLWDRAVTVTGIYNAELNSTPDGGNGRQSVLAGFFSISISCDNPPTGFVGTPYDHLFPVAGGTAPLTFSITAGALPDGLSIDVGTGEVTGIPTAPNTFNFTVQVVDAFGSTASVTCSILILITLAVSCGAPPAGIVGTPYTHTFPVVGGVPPYAYNIFSGALPDGLVLNTLTGEVTGIPTTVGVFNFVVQVQDSTATLSQVPCGITVTNPLPPPPIPSPELLPTTLFWCLVAAYLTIDHNTT